MDIVAVGWSRASLYSAKRCQGIANPRLQLLVSNMSIAQKTFDGSMSVIPPNFPLPRIVFSVLPKLVRSDCR